MTSIDKVPVPDAASAKQPAALPIPAGRVNALIGVLASGPLAHPAIAVSLSALGVGMAAFVGLCASTPVASEATVPVLLPLTALAHRLGAPMLSSLVIDILMYGCIGLCCLGLAGMLWASNRGWRPDPRRVFWLAAAVVAIIVSTTPVGTSDPASCAAYGRIAALGRDPYTFLPASLPGGASNDYTALVDPRWRATPSVYGPVATWMQQAAASVGGSRPWLTIWILMIVTGIAFLAAGYLLLRSADDPVRASLLWTANPLLIYVLVMGAQLDAFVALAGIAAILISRRGSAVWHDLAVAAVIGVAGAVKVNAALIGLGLAVPLIRERAWGRLVRIAAGATATTLALSYAYAPDALRPLLGASTRVIAPSLWRLVQMAGDHLFPNPTVTSAFIGVIWPLLLLGVAWWLYRQLSPDVPAVVAAICSLSLAWALVAPWTLSWYTALAWVMIALLPSNPVTRWLTLATVGLALLHFKAGNPGIHPKVAPSS